MRVLGVYYLFCSIAQLHSGAEVGGAPDSRVRALDLCGCLFAWLPNNSPLFHVVAVRLDRGEPAVLNQNSGQVCSARWISGAIRAIDADIPCGDGGSGPTIYDPVQQLFAWRGS